MLQIPPQFKTQLTRALLLGGLVALLGTLFSSLPTGRWLEEELGLPWLFELRGKRSVPDEVIVISMDSRSSQQLGLPNKPRLWPRSLHGQLVDRLAAFGVSSIVFDVIFDEERDSNDNIVFAQAMERANNVILYQYLKKTPIFQEDNNRKQQIIGIKEELITPVPVLREAALGLSQFPLPKVPARVNHFNLFSASLGHLPTLPVLAQLAHSLDEYPILSRLLNEQGVPGSSQIPPLPQYRNLQEVGATLRGLFLRDGGLTNWLTEQLNNNQVSLKLAPVINTFSMPDSAYLNFYGPPGTVRTIPYYRILEQGASYPDLKGKTVFVGFSEGFLPEQADAFYTVFTDPETGLDISGVEIAATAMANLIEQSVIQASSSTTDIAILLCWALGLALGLRMLPGLAVIPAAISGSVIYGWVVYHQFTTNFTWLPLTIPLLVQMPLVVLSTLAWKYQDAQHQRQNIRRAFGYHLPISVVDDLANSKNHITETEQQVHGVVMATDAAQYTRLSESMTPGDLRSLMNRYYEVLFTPVRRSGGTVSDVIGDAALAFWSNSKEKPNYCQQACQAALDIIKAIDNYNTNHPEHALPTRIGLHYGEMVIGHVGAVDHYEYRVVGDIVNTATRIEGLNKLLGTRIIVSGNVLADVSGLVTRKLGKFILVGKQQALTLYELVSINNKNELKIDYRVFEDALAECQAGNITQARAGFTHFIEQYGEDGPSRYYLNLLEDKVKETSTSYEVITLQQK